MRLLQRRGQRILEGTEAVGFIAFHLAGEAAHAALERRVVQMHKLRLRPSLGCALHRALQHLVCVPVLTRTSVNQQHFHKRFPSQNILRILYLFESAL